VFTLIVDVCCIVNTVVALNWSWRTPRTHFLSPAMRAFFFRHLARALRMRRPADAAPAPAATPPPRRRTHHDDDGGGGGIDLTDFHDMECPYARMSARQRRRVLDGSPTGSSRHDELRREHGRAVEAVRFAAAHLKNEDDFSEVHMRTHMILVGVSE